MWDDEEVDYFIVVNGEEQYSLWPAGSRLPEGWSIVGEPGSKQSRLERIAELWTDLRPRSLRETKAG
ncbi:MbtH family NRPS accessory protein [Agrobacterium rhizogenes]|uniref:MbtH-like domain-containing protein n=1 Tax=Rhizobium rhizogenes NBRC 13257 TaxID=1220581 RepID=A0AA87Q6T9_RHIRH|nr:MbtH family NRPS accessory protein [Rhizobium rhizogenes]OCJ22187.1 hypothetical protein A6U88_30455 [Agrobacterium sp. B131/95]OCJ27269.1 hypothetical protein A6U89_29255 [Agrobacterium sp. B133/95]NTG71532.1 MbtH family NRPS accessory protein [Rhizobium rhizogenes]NTG90627.1 MbtH family NRPS accessory protein [Rhizobium rhizogenes]NTI46154.1 MbtH family NRPS accessory protein [Rhizobium rhizogenes]